MKALCGVDARDNLCELRVALAAYTNKEFMPFEIEWFIYTPGAFKFIKKFGKCNKYINIDIENNRFIWAEDFQSYKDRLLEQVKIFMLYLFVGTIGVSLLLSVQNIYNRIGLIPTIFTQIFAVIFCCIAIVFLWHSNVITDSKQLIKTEI
jgi:hypothetical protein